jgi:para-nitrobenzyl esterase
MVWLHGGGFQTGWGHQRFFDGAALARKGVVVVTINYRLGVFGFFAHSLLSAESPNQVSGNYGLLDQIKALQWVKTNIDVFGGNPNCVTIFGQSAGAYSVNLLSASPLAVGLFHRAIAQSPPGGLTMGTTLAAAEDQGRKLAATLIADRTTDTLTALRALDAETLLKTALGSESLKARMSGVDDGFNFGPTTDDYVLAKNCQTVNVPTILGVNAEEGAYWASLEELQPILAEVDGYERFVRWQYRDKAKAILELYPANAREDVRNAFIDFFGDSVFVLGVRAIAQDRCDKGAKTYVYCFSRRPPSDEIDGAYHGCEIPYVFDNLDQKTSTGVEKRDQEIADTISQQWVHFARTGDPNSTTLPNWPANDSTTDEYLYIGDRTVIRSALRRNHCRALNQVLL